MYLHSAATASSERMLNASLGNRRASIGALEATKSAASSWLDRAAVSFPRSISQRRVTCWSAMSHPPRLLPKRCQIGHFGGSVDDDQPLLGVHLAGQVVKSVPRISTAPRHPPGHGGATGGLFIFFLAF